jgi:integrase/recombinase XerD
MYASLLKRLADKFKKLPTAPEPLEEFISKFPGDMTRLNYFKILRYFYIWAEKRFGVGNPTSQMRTPKVKKKVVPSLDGEEMQRLFSLPYSNRDSAVLKVLAGCGIRVGEAANLKFKDIGEQTLRVDGKTGERNVPLNSDIRDSLLVLKNGHKPDTPIFWGTNPVQPLGHAGFAGIVQKAFKRADIEGKRASPHTLRHTFGRNWITQGGDVTSLKAILGHASIAMTQQYVALSTEDLVSKNKQYNPLISITGDRLTTSDERLTASDSELSLCYTIVK